MTSTSINLCYCICACVLCTVQSVAGSTPPARHAPASTRALRLDEGVTQDPDPLDRVPLVRGPQALGDEEHVREEAGRRGLGESDGALDGDGVGAVEGGEDAEAVAGAADGGKGVLEGNLLDADLGL